MRVLTDDRFLEKVAGQGRSEAQAPSIQRIVRYVCQCYNITPSALAEPLHSQDLAQARVPIGWLARQINAGLTPARLDEEDEQNEAC